MDAPAVTTRTAEQVLDTHAQLTARYRYPSWHVAEYLFEQARQVIATPGLGRKAAQHMLYPVLRPGAPVNWELGQRVAQMISGDLFVADTAQVTRVMLEAMRASAANTPPPASVAVEELPFPDMFTWLDDCWPIPDAEGGSYPVRAVSWRRIEANTNEGTWPAVRVVFWAWFPDDPEMMQVPDILRRLGELQVIHVAVVPLDSAFDVPEAPGSPERVSADAAIVMLRLLWLWLGMEIVDNTPAPLPRQGLKRAARHLRSPVIRVIKLRKVRHATDAEGTHRDVDWSCQWPVRGHHRHIERYDGRHHSAVPHPEDRGRCEDCGARITWVRPYVKGPDGAPLKVSRTIYKLAR